MCSGPQQPDAHRMDDGFHLNQLFPQILAHLAHIAADPRVDLDVTLHEFRFHGIAQMFRQCIQHLIDRTCQR